MADAKGGSEAAALMEIAKMVNELRNAVILVGLIVGKAVGPPKLGAAKHESAAAKAREKLRGIGQEGKSDLIPPIGLRASEVAHGRSRPAARA